MKINCIAIDDEPLALELMESYINKVPSLQLKGLFHKPLEAMDILRSGKIELVYMDVHMPDISGIDFLKGLERPPKVIFITAYDQFAVQGFEMNAIDYLLKPVPFNRFLLAADRAMEVLRSKNHNENDFIFVKAEHNIIKISLDSIYYIEGYKDYIKIHTDQSNPILTLTTIKSIEELLPDSFQRIHRSYIISVNKIISFRNSKVYIKNKYIPIGESYGDLFYQTVVDGRLR